jgi:hypothetical protein
MAAPVGTARRRGREGNEMAKLTSKQLEGYTYRMLLGIAQGIARGKFGDDAANALKGEYLENLRKFILDNQDD